MLVGDGTVESRRKAHGTRLSGLELPLNAVGG